MKKNIDTKPIPDQAIMTEELKASTEFLKSKGIHSFLLLFHPVPGMTVSHIENIKVSDAFTALITGFDQVVNLELEHSKARPHEYRAIYTNLMIEFHAMIKNTNEKLMAFQPDGSDVGKA